MRTKGDELYAGAFAQRQKPLAESLYKRKRALSLPKGSFEDSRS